MTEDGEIYDPLDKEERDKLTVVMDKARYDGFYMAQKATTGQEQAWERRLAELQEKRDQANNRNKTRVQRPSTGT